MIYPLKIQLALTQVCIDINNAKNISDIDHLAELPKLLEQYGYTFPSWLKVWMKMLEDDPLLNAEEHFSMPKLKLSHFMGEASYSAYKNKKRLELMKVDAAISSICSVQNSAYRNALFVIASQILLDSTADSALSFEWHCKTDEIQSLTNKHNYSLFVEILQRETDFWQFIPTSRSNPPPKIKLQPSQSI
jgi:hypothetical protein